MSTGRSRATSAWTTPASRGGKVDGLGSDVVNLTSSRTSGSTTAAKFSPGSPLRPGRPHTPQSLRFCKRIRPPSFASPMREPGTRRNCKPTSYRSL